MHGKQILQQMNPYKPGKSEREIKEQFSLDHIVKLSSNENPYGQTPLIEKKFNMDDLNYELYPDGHANTLREKLSKKYGISENTLVFGSGSDELIQIISRAFLSPDTHTVMATPTFPQYRHHALIEGSEITEVPLKNGAHDLELMLEKIKEKENTKVVWLCTPNNPTGVSIEPDAFDRFLTECPDDVLIVLDEAYYEYQDESYELNAIERVQKHKNLITLRTFSKAYGLASVRMGYGMTTETIANQLNIVRGPFNTSKIAQKFASIAIEDDEFVRESVEKNNIVKQNFEKFLQTINWEYYPSQANFMLVKTPRSGTELYEFLLKNGYIVRPGELLGYDQSVRITLGEKDDMTTLHLLIQTYNRETVEQG